VSGYKCIVLLHNVTTTHCTTGSKIRTEEDAVRALVQLHGLGPEVG